jgi:hypothetical protein
MLSSLINTTNIKALCAFSMRKSVKEECITIKLFGLSTKILTTDIVIFFLGLVVTIMLAEMLANYMVVSIEEAIKRRKEMKGPLSSPKIIQCDKCYNEYGEAEIKKTKIFGRIFHQYCSSCLIQQGSSMRKSQSDAKINYNN